MALQSRIRPLLDEKPDIVLCVIPDGDGDRTTQRTAASRSTVRFTNTNTSNVPDPLMLLAEDGFFDVTALFAVS